MTFLLCTKSCFTQIGGSDQWGNIFAVLDLTSRTDELPIGAAKSHGGAFGITTPLLTTATGAKFGKSEGNAIWLNGKLTSVYDFYQVSEWQ